MKIDKSQFVIFYFCLTIVLLPFSRLSELPILILAIFGVAALFKGHDSLKKDPRFKVLSIVYGCYLSLMLISSIDSYWQSKSLIVAFASLRFYLATLALLYFTQKKHFRLLVKVPAVICMVWTLDALIQYFLGYNLLGLASYPDRLNGIFGEDHAKLGPVLALLFPCLLIQLIDSPKWLKWLSVLLVSIVVLLSGTRSAWIMLAFTLVVFFMTHVKQNKIVLLAKTTTAAFLIVICLWFGSTGFQDRVNRTVSAFEGSVNSLDFALANRLPIWNVALEIIKEHPVNGVGAHAFRKAYPDFASENDIWQKNGGVGMHAHHWVLEILSDTGFIGLLIFSVAVFFLLRFIVLHKDSNLSWPFVTAMVAAFLPIVSTYSLFASFWSICIWIIGAGLLTVSFMGKQGDD